MENCLRGTQLYREERDVVSGCSVRHPIVLWKAVFMWKGWEFWILLDKPSQRSIQNEPIFRLLLKVAVNGAHQCGLSNFFRSFWLQPFRFSQVKKQFKRGATSHHYVSQMDVTATCYSIDDCFSLLVDRGLVGAPKNATNKGTGKGAVSGTVNGTAVAAVASNSKGVGKGSGNTTLPKGKGGWGKGVGGVGR